MQENSFNENNSSKKLTKRKKNKKYSEENIEKENNNNKNIEEKNNLLKTEKQIEIQKKLKHIFNDVRAKGKYEYNKQEIPEHLKYHSDSDSSEYSKNKTSEKKINLKENPKNNKISKMKINDNLSSKISINKKDINDNVMTEIINKDNNIKKEKKFNNVRDIIEKLKAKKNEKEDLARLEREAEEQSIMREKNKKNNENNEEKINESEIEREAEKIRKKEKRMEERRLAREKRRKMEEEEKLKKEKEFEEKKKQKLSKIKNSDTQKQEDDFNKNENKVYINAKKKMKYNNGKKISKEIKNNEINETNKKTNDKIITNKNNTLGTYKKPTQKNLMSGDKIYRPKKAIGVIKGRSQEKIGQNLLNSKNINENKFCKSPNITYSKKKSIDGLRETNFLLLNKSFGDLRPNFEKEKNFMGGMYNINTLDITSLPDLNSSFDSRLLNMNKNFQFNLGGANEFYKRTAQKNYNNSTINSGNITNSSNRFANMNNLFGINGLSYINGENDFINISNNNFNNNSFYDLLQPQISPYDLNSSYSIGYTNPLANYTYNNNQVNLSNLLNNNYIGMNSLNNSLNLNEILTKKTPSQINIEDLLVLEEKVKDIINALNTTKDMKNECFDFWNYYFNTSLNGSLDKIFDNLLDSNNVQISIKYILISILICYDCSFDIDILNNVYSILKDLLNLNHKNLILIYEHLLSKISIENKDNIWVIKLLNLVNASKNNDFNNNLNFNEYNNTINEYSMTSIEKINFNTGIIIQNVRVLLKNFKTPKVDYLISLFKKITEKTYEEINDFYQQFILRLDNISGSILASVILKINPNINFNPEPAPYIHNINNKKYTLVLDLGETLVHFKVNPENEAEGILKVRPWVTEFLDEMMKYYELIIFTGGTEDYANLLIDAIDENKSYFKHRLYRQHMIIIDNDFVKDLTRIGRPLDKIVIVDNMPQNFRLQKENGINIKSFWGEDRYDTALSNLSSILVKIAQEGGDIRKGLEKYRNEIIEKVTSNLSK